MIDDFPEATVLVHFKARNDVGVSYNYFIL